MVDRDDARFDEGREGHTSEKEANLIKGGYLPDGRKIDLWDDSLLLTSDEVMDLIRIKRTSIKKLKRLKLLEPIKVLSGNRYTTMSIRAYLGLGPRP